VADITGEDWGNIHAKAWRDPEFKRLLETDPTKAIRDYGQSIGKTFDKIVFVRPRPNIADEFLPFVNPFPPSCC
jgi:hypothetical protein